MLYVKVLSSLLVCTLLLSSAVRADSDTRATSNDDQIASLVSTKLASADPSVARLISIGVHEGVVTLTGRAYSASQVAKVIQDARGVPGVVRVLNHVTLP
jgi:osmotically-inducible protein OsmY